MGVGNGYWIDGRKSFTCRFPVGCGDGRVNGAERCERPQVGCNFTTCRALPGWFCAPNRECTPICGNGIVTPPEGNENENLFIN